MFNSHVGLESPFTTSLHKRHVAAEDLSIPEQSPQNKETDKKYVKTYNLQKVWDSCDSRSTLYNSNDQWGFFNPVEHDHWGKGRGSEGEKG